MQPKQRLSDTSITNQSTLLCDLRDWNGAASAAWIALTGTQEAVGARLARMLEDASINRLDDFGGVCDTFLRRGEEYLASPPRTVSGAAVFSFTPKKRVLAEASEMARSARAAGYSLMILTMQKEGRFGKVWVLCAALRHFTRGPLTYYEDTGTIIDDLKASPEGSKSTRDPRSDPGVSALNFSPRLSGRDAAPISARGIAAAVGVCSAAKHHWRGP
jgi:hypothetical protein